MLLLIAAEINVHCFYFAGKFPFVQKNLYQTQ